MTPLQRLREQNRKLLALCVHALGVIEQCGLEPYDAGRIVFKLRVAIRKCEGK